MFGVFCILILVFFIAFLVIVGLAMERRDRIKEEKAQVERKILASLAKNKPRPSTVSKEKSSQRENSGWYYDGQYYSSIDDFNYRNDTDYYDGEAPGQFSDWI